MDKKSQIELGFQVGDRVFDLLTEKPATILGIKYQNGKCNSNTTVSHAVGFWLNNNYLDGRRHPWEISEINKEK